VQGVSGHPSKQSGGPKKNNWKKWRAEEEERHKGSLTPKKQKTPHLFHSNTHQSCQMVYFQTGPWNGEGGDIFRHLEYIKAIWYILRKFGNLVAIWYLSPVLVYCVKKNQAAMIHTSYKEQYYNV
jgi:hypothetical protein